MLNAIFRPLEYWPGKPTPPAARRRAAFKASYQKTLDLLEYELKVINAKDILIQVRLELSQIRNDGWPRSSASPTSSEIIVSFLRGKDIISMPCDRFDDWEDNLHAIALSLEALRKIDRYGVTSNGQQYQGFKQIEAPNKEDARAGAEFFIAQAAGVRIEDVRADLSTAYRGAAQRLHPDYGGSHAEFSRLVEAKKVLEA